MQDFKDITGKNKIPVHRGHGEWSPKIEGSVTTASRRHLCCGLLIAAGLLLSSSEPLAGKRRKKKSPAVELTATDIDPATVADRDDPIVPQAKQAARWLRQRVQRVARTPGAPDLLVRMRLYRDAWDRVLSDFDDQLRDRWPELKAALESGKDLPQYTPETLARLRRGSQGKGVKTYKPKRPQSSSRSPAPLGQSPQQTALAHSIRASFAGEDETPSTATKMTALVPDTSRLGGSGDRARMQDIAGFLQLEPSARDRAMTKLATARGTPISVVIEEDSPAVVQQMLERVQKRLKATSRYVELVETVRNRVQAVAQRIATCHTRLQQAAEVLLRTNDPDLGAPTAAQVRGALVQVRHVAIELNSVERLLQTQRQQTLDKSPPLVDLVRRNDVDELTESAEHFEQQHIPAQFDALAARMGAMVKGMRHLDEGMQATLTLLTEVQPRQMLLLLERVPWYPRLPNPARKEPFDPAASTVDPGPASGQPAQRWKSGASRVVTQRKEKRRRRQRQLPPNASTGTASEPTTAASESEARGAEVTDTAEVFIPSGEQMRTRVHFSQPSQKAGDALWPSSGIPGPQGAEHLLPSALKALAQLLGQMCCQEPDALRQSETGRRLNVKPRTHQRDRFQARIGRKHRLLYFAPGDHVGNNEPPYRHVELENRGKTKRAKQRRNKGGSS